MTDNWNMRRKRKNETTYLIFSRILNRLMKERRMGVREVARICSVSPSTVVNWRAGALPEDYFAVKKLAECLGVSFCFLLTGEEEGKQNNQSQGSIFDSFHGQCFYSGTARVIIQSLIPEEVCPNKSDVKGKGDA